jgi:L-seryl-tRNA(Ser) seleniumtransferase
MTGFLQSLGVPRRLNAAGTLTRLGGALMAPEVLQAMQEAAACSVDMAELQTAASQRIAGLTGAEAGLVTTGASAGLTLATAACLAGWDAARMAALPDTQGMPARVLMHRTHRNTYDHAVRLAGGCIVDIGHNDRGTGAGVRSLEAWEIESALDAQTAAFVFVASPEALPLLPVVLEVMHRHGLPVVVDAAAQLPPRENLRRYVEMGADLVVFSGGKALEGPQSTGLLIGRRDLIGSALLQMMDMDVHPRTWAPAGLVDMARLRGTPLHGIGRGFKAGKEEIAGLLCALQRFVERDEAAQVARWTQRLQVMVQAWTAQAPMLAPVLWPAGPSQSVPQIALHTPEPAAQFSRRLQSMAPPVHLAEGRMDDGLLLVNPMALATADDALLVQQIAHAAQDAWPSASGTGAFAKR